MVSSVRGVSSDSVVPREMRTKVQSSTRRWVLWRDEGVGFPERWDVECIVDDLHVKLSVAVDHGRFVCEQAVVTHRPGGSPITSASLRRLSIRKLMVDSVPMLNLVEGDALEPFDDSGDPESRRALTERQGRVLDRMSRRQGRPRSTNREALLHQVVDAYRTAVALDHNAPRKVAAAQLGYSSGYVGRLLVEARRKGLLGPADPGRAGERRMAVPGRPAGHTSGGGVGA